MKQKYVITFAGPPGSSKSPIATYLSWNLRLPIFDNDVIRTEIREDVFEYDDAAYQQRKNDRVEALLESGISFIHDASVDRVWPEYYAQLSEAGYEVFVISIDISKEFLQKLLRVKGYDDELARIDSKIEEHITFLESHSGIVNIHITDANFQERLNVSFVAVQHWIKLL